MKLINGLNNQHIHAQITKLNNKYKYKEHDSAKQNCLNVDVNLN